MARSLASKENVEPVDSDYPYGRIKDNSGANDGTPVNEDVYGDFHQFFAKLFAESGLTYNELPDNDYSGFQLFEALFALMGGVYKKVIEIGDWDMVSTPSVFILHGMTVSKIRSIHVFVRNDAGTNISNLMVPDVDSASSFPETDGAVGANATGVILQRRTGGNYDSVNYNSTSFNRGWITIEYIP